MMGVEIKCVKLKDSIRNCVLTAEAVEAKIPRPLTVWIPHLILQRLASS